MILDEHSYWAEILTRISATDVHSDDSRCTERMREYAETICYVPLEHEPKLTPFAALLAEATR